MSLLVAVYNIVLTKHFTIYFRLELEQLVFYPILIVKIVECLNINWDRSFLCKLISSMIIIWFVKVK